MCEEIASAGELAASFPKSVNSAVLAHGSQNVCSSYMDPNPTPTIRDLYPHLTENELAEAEHILERYLALVLRIFERTDSEAHP